MQESPLHAGASVFELSLHEYELGQSALPVQKLQVPYPVPESTTQRFDSHSEFNVHSLVLQSPVVKSQVSVFGH